MYALKNKTSETHPQSTPPIPKAPLPNLTGCHSNMQMSWVQLWLSILKQQPKGADVRQDLWEAQHVVSPPQPVSSQPELKTRVHWSCWQALCGVSIPSQSSLIRAVLIMTHGEWILACRGQISALSVPLLQKCQANTKRALLAKRVYPSFSFRCSFLILGTS